MNVFYLKKRLSVFFPWFRKFRLPRIWSNQELEKWAPKFSGSIINVSGWTDDDKEGRKYADYFVNKNTYFVSNYRGERGYQNNSESEFFLDLEEKLPINLKKKFDVVFNHTTLEHIYDVSTAFKNLCLLTKDILIVVVPFSQELHSLEGSYSDYWRFTPYCLRRLMESSGLSLVYASANSWKDTSIYLFAIGSRNPGKWRTVFPKNEVILHY